MRPSGVMVIEVAQKEEMSGGGKNGEGKGFGFAICRKRANRGSLNIKERKQGGVVWRDVDPYIIRVGVKQKKRGGKKFREG